MSTPRFGEIIVDVTDTTTTIITKVLWDNILKNINLDKGVYPIWYKTGQHYRTEYGYSGRGLTERIYYDIYLIDNYYNKYKITASIDHIHYLQKLQVSSNIGLPQSCSKLPYIFTDIKKGCKYDTPLSNEEIIYIQKYCTINDAENMEILKYKMKDYFLMENTNNKISELNSIVEKLERINKSYTKKIDDMAYKIVELEKKQIDEPDFIVYLKKLFAWE